jgi:hypothetical protein
MQVLNINKYIFLKVGDSIKAIEKVSISFLNAIDVGRFFGYEVPTEPER